MASSGQSEFSGDERPPSEVHPDRLDYLEARVQMLEERIPETQLLHQRFLPRAFAVFGHYLAAGLMLYIAGTVVVMLLTFVTVAFDWIPGWSGEGAVPEGPALTDVRSLPVDASGRGTLQGRPTGEATVGVKDGSFVLVLNPAPPGLPERTTLSVAFDRTTEVYRGAERQVDPVEAMHGDGPSDADPTAAGTVVVAFHVRGGEVFAERLELSSEFHE